MYRIIEHIYGVEGLKFGRVYVIEGEDGLTLIDTSTANSLPQIGKELLKIGHKLGEIKRIVITHAHPDHFGSLAALKEATGAQTYAPEYYESEVIRGEKPILRPPVEQLSGMSKLMAASFKSPVVSPAHVDHELKEGERIDDVLPGLEVIGTPGHSPGHCSFWQPAQHLLFAGDAVIRMPFSTGLSLPSPVFSVDMDEVKRSIRKLAELDVNTLCMGHGKPVVSEAGVVLRKFASKF